MSERASTKGRERPILFSAPMVRALLDGRKTQTRRIIKPRGRVSLFDGSWSDSYVLDLGNQSWRDQEIPIKRGDRLWVREAWHAARSLDKTPPRDIPRDADIEHAATARSYAEIGLKGKLRPGMFMPRWASRLTLTVTDVRVQRLWGINEEDATDEGIECWSEPGMVSWRVEDEMSFVSAIGAYQLLWNRINGPDSWAANPWVAAYTFTVERRNIDEGRTNLADATPSNPLSEGRERS